MAIEISKTNSYSFKYTDKDSSLPMINECICDLQASLAQYFTVAAIKHMKLKTIFKNSLNDGLFNAFIR